MKSAQPSLVASSVRSVIKSGLDQIFGIATGIQAGWHPLDFRQECD